MDQVKIGKLIARLRKNKGLTQRELGEMVGVGFRAVSKWENGLTLPDISIINDLSKILGISTDELLHGEINDKELFHESKKVPKFILIAIPIIIIISLIITIIIINKNKTYIYELYTDDKDYYIEGELQINNDNISLSINKIDFLDKEFKKTTIINYQYELYLDDTFLVGYGYMNEFKVLQSPVLVSEWVKDFKIKYNDKIKDKKIKSKIVLNISFVDNKNKEIKKAINISIKEKKQQAKTFYLTS